MLSGSKLSKVAHKPGFSVSNCIVMYLRLLTSATIRIDPDSYAPFLFHPETGDEILPQEFCERYVEATGKEAGESYYY